MVVVSIDGGDLPDLQTSDRFDSRVRDMSGSQSAIRMSVACKMVLGAGLAVPIHDAVVSVDFPLLTRAIEAARADIAKLRSALPPIDLSVIAKLSVTVLPTGVIPSNRIQL